MKIFKQFTKDQLKIHMTRVEILGISLDDAQKAARQISWLQCHIVKNQDDTVNLSLITGTQPSATLWEFLGGDEPDPVKA